MATLTGARPIRAAATVCSVMVTTLETAEARCLSRNPGDSPVRVHGTRKGSAMADLNVGALRKGAPEAKEDSGPGTYIRMEKQERDLFVALIKRLGYDWDNLDRGTIKKVGQAVAQLGLAALATQLDAADAEAAAEAAKASKASK